MKDLRVNRLELWAKGLDSSIPASARLENVSGDASFRRYFRFPDASVPRVFVDAPPEHEDNSSFARISAATAQNFPACTRQFQPPYAIQDMHKPLPPAITVN